MYEDDSEKHKKNQQNERDLELLTIRNIMRTENGRDFLWKCLQNCSTFRGVFDVEPRQHAYNEGKRSHGVWLDTQIKEAAPDEYILMLKEHINE